MEKQIAGQFDQASLKKIGRGALIAGGGTAVTYLLQYLSGIDFGMFTPIVVALCSISINAVKQFMAGIEI